MNVGDFVYHDFELCQIKNMEGNRISAVTNGFIETSGSNLVVFPLNLKTKIASDNFDEFYKKVRDIQSLNHPDVRRYLISLWQSLCALLLNGGDDKNAKDAISDIYTSARAFVVGILDADKNKRTINGVQIFR